LYTILTGIASFVGLKIKGIYEKYINDKTKKDVVESTVKYVEQIYSDLKGEEKLEKAKENIIELLNQKGISITELEMDVLIEATCNSFKSSLKGE
jgi:intergrase/recombinase